VDNVIRTVEENLLAGALLVIIVLFAFLGNLRAGLIMAAAIPLSMLFAVDLMLRAGISASLLSLGAIDFGLLVNGAVVMVENAIRCLGERQRQLGRALTESERRETLTNASLEVARPVAFGVAIVLVVFLPILSLQGVEGKLFRPMALTMIFALLGSLIVSLTLMPVLASLFLNKQVKDKEPWLARAAHRLYAPVLGAALRYRKLILAGAVALLAGAMLLASHMGHGFGV